LPRRVKPSRRIRRDGEKTQTGIETDPKHPVRLIEKRRDGEKTQTGIETIYRGLMKAFDVGRDGEKTQTGIETRLPCT